METTAWPTLLAYVILLVLNWHDDALTVSIPGCSWLPKLYLATCSLPSFIFAQLPHLATDSLHRRTATTEGDLRDILLVKVNSNQAAT